MKENNKIVKFNQEVSELKCKEQLKCVCCKGTGIVEGEHYDDLYACANCLGKGTF